MAVGNPAPTAAAAVFALSAGVLFVAGEALAGGIAAGLALAAASVINTGGPSRRRSRMWPGTNGQTQAWGISALVAWLFGTDRGRSDGHGPDGGSGCSGGCGGGGCGGGS